MKTIAIEEHFTTQGYQDYLRSRSAYPRIETVADENGVKTERLARNAKSSRPITPRLSGKLLDLGPARFAEMDRAGIDMQVVMLAGPGVEDLLDIPNANAQAREINDELAAACKKYPERLAGFATLSYGDPGSAAKELERAVTQLGYKVLGADRILYAVDYPYEIIEEGARFMDAVDIPEADKAKICHFNAEKLLAL